MVGYELEQDIFRRFRDKQVYVYLGARIIFDLRESELDVQLFTVVHQVGIVDKVNTAFRVPLRFLKSHRDPSVTTV